MPTATSHTLIGISSDAINQGAPPHPTEYPTI